MNAQTLICAAALPFAVPTSRWDDSVAATLSPAELLLYRANLLGSDLTVTNFGGGNTSAKLVEVDPLPFAHVNHVHPDAIIALAGSSGSEAATQAIWGGRIGWLPWKRPGYTLGVMLRDYVAANPHLEGVMLAGHGIICWADSARACCEHTVQLIADAVNYLNAKLADKPAFGGRVVADNPDRAAIAADLMPRLRGLMTSARNKLGHWSDDPEALEFTGSADFARLAVLGTSCPDHFLRTKIAPLALDPARLRDDGYLAQQIADYRAIYAGYYERCKRSNSPAMRDANPVAVLVPGVGRITFATDKTTARLAGDLYGNAVNVMCGAEAIGEYIALDEQEAFDIEYWLLEEAKLQRMPATKPLVGKIALVTGGAGGIGAASAARRRLRGAGRPRWRSGRGCARRVYQAVRQRHGPRRCV
ncbi:class II aldolase/adducin family protein [Novosphingobium sp. AAP83]|uniref:class II aldolase/adducin family protein n=1 Tax=Novosphingobium sp. AAP83 TaxID=1523425 RepID=UPI000A738B88|nr:class II aldolase/adducin family protein [Novosphingobium sp. AAP83]